MVESVACCTLFIAAMRADSSGAVNPSTPNAKLIIVVDEIDGDRWNVKSRVMRQLTHRYEKEGIEVATVSRDEIGEWVERTVPDLEGAVLNLRATAYAESANATGVEIVTFVAADGARPCDESVENPIRVIRTLISLEACTAEQYPTIIDPRRAGAWVLSPRWRRGSTPESHPMMPCRDWTRESAGLFRKIFGVRLEGCKITDAPPHSVAWRAGIRPGDEIVAVNGTRVSGCDLLKALGHSPANEIRLRLKRDSNEPEVVVHPTELTEDQLLPLRCIGASIADLSPDEDTRLKRNRWISALGEDRTIIVLGFWHSQPSTRFVVLDLLYNRFGRRGLRCVLINSGQSLKAWEGLVKDNPISATQVRDSALSRALNVETVAPCFVLDSQGRILLRDVFSYELAGVIEGLLDAVDASREQKP